MRKDSTDPEFQQRQQIIPGIFGMNDINRGKEVLHKAMGSSYIQHIDAPRVSVLQNVNQRNTSVRGIAKVTEPEAVRLPAGLVPVVEPIGWNGTGDFDSPILVAPSTYPLSDRVLVVRIVCLLRAGRFPVRVANLGDENNWLKPRIRITIMHRVYDIQPDDMQVDFQRVTFSEE